MISINDIKNNLSLQGTVKVTRWIDNEEYVLWHGDAESMNSGYEYMESEILYMYSIDQVGLVIEVE